MVYFVVAFFEWMNPFEVKYVSICLFIICLGILLLINSIILKKGGKLFRIIVLLISLFAIVPIIYYYHFSIEVEGKNYLKEKYHFSANKIKVEKKYSYSPPAFDFDSPPTRLRSVILSVDDEKYYLVYVDGWKEVIFEENDNWNYSGDYELKDEE